ncbi:uncharacterized protein LOC116023768 [Ipomoea triloba]|uniref:uncharacterized protein LOC116023768 n=1 Tax=Ipomoea triloba TaxID=35885 RepID=UPI00125E90DF|nr:uncharacterized protein LOC116023768 [Ipomoea triloba]
MTIDVMMHTNSFTGELKRLQNLVADAKANNINVVCALVKRMLDRNMFLFGFVDINEGSATERVNELTEIQNARVQTAYAKLFANTKIEHYTHLDMGMELDADLIKQRSTEYAMAKRRTIEESCRLECTEGFILSTNRMWSSVGYRISTTGRTDAS